MVSLEQVSLRVLDNMKCHAAAKKSLRLTFLTALSCKMIQGLLLRVIFLKIQVIIQEDVARYTHSMGIFMCRPQNFSHIDDLLLTTKDSIH